ncbi:S8 family serine peptidase [Blastococcus sp. CT_GayMR20]|uniref:S8 family serine peptidase n=1 Tax=Blastococcus sp. CT_GayMR20 TaxID=2559609 RepID=UPI001430394A|nr:S8 family serine peptidase [Blastococcus sp. CT_GayMR20]
MGMNKRGRATRPTLAFDELGTGVALRVGRITTVATATALVVGLTGPVTAQASPGTAADSVEVIVQEAAGAGDLPERAVTALGGTVEEPLAIIGGFTATLPANRLAALRGAAGVISVTENAPVELLDAVPAEVQDQAGSMFRVTHEVTGATALWERGVDGKGVDVALLDSGVVPVEGLSGRDKVVYGPDLSFESQVCDEDGCEGSPQRNLDTYGHGTHLAGIIAGRDSNANPRTFRDPNTFAGVAPGSRIVSLKLADAIGATDVSQVIAGIDWVVQNRNRNGLNIRVLNLSFGTDGVQDYQLDPLTYAVEQAWHAGIVVVVAAGNGGFGTPKLNNPAYDPYVIAVGGADSRGTYDVQDDVVPAWSSTGDGTRNPDIVAPGASIVSLRSPGSYLDESYPNARQSERFFRGSGTSQAAAVVSGAAALLIQQRPDATPDQIKALLMGTAQRLPVADPIAQGDGIIDLRAARDAAAPQAVQSWPRATGLGTLEGARGTANLAYDGTPLEGELDVRGQAWDPAVWAAASAAQSTWTGGQLRKGTWTGGAWNGTDWFVADPGDGVNWNGRIWGGQTWSSLTWAGRIWGGRIWGGDAWTGRIWGGRIWGGNAWAGRIWGGATWSGADWA